MSGTDLAYAAIPMSGTDLAYDAIPMYGTDLAYAAIPGEGTYELVVSLGLRMGRTYVSWYPET
eukprot:768107-Rhodomonas_salina.1